MYVYMYMYIHMDVYMCKDINVDMDICLFSGKPWQELGMAYW